MAIEEYIERCTLDISFGSGPDGKEVSVTLDSPGFDSAIILSCTVTIPEFPKE